MRLLLTVLAFAVCTGPVHSADVESPADPAIEQRMQTARATAKSEEGRAALQRYRANQTDPEPLVAAALAYSEAHKLYEALGDNDAVCDAQANLFWCKKQMNLDTVQAYLKEAKTDTKAGLARVDQVVERKVDAN